MTSVIAVNSHCTIRHIHFYLSSTTTTSKPILFAVPITHISIGIDRLAALTIVLLFDFVSSFAVTAASRITGLRQSADIQAHKYQPEQCLETPLA